MEEIIIIYSLSIYNLRLPLLTTCRGDIPAVNKSNGYMHNRVPYDMYNCF